MRDTKSIGKDLFAEERHTGRLADGSDDDQTLHFLPRAAGFDEGEGIRLERVLALRHALRTGVYAVSTEKLADCLMERMLGR